MASLQRFHSFMMRFICFKCNCGPTEWEPCENHTPTATGSCSCGFDTLRDGSLDFDRIAKEIGFECNQEVSTEEELAAERSDVRIGHARIFSEEELDEAIHFFNPVQKLGEGGYGSVFLAKLKDGQTVAVKQLCDSTIEAIGQYDLEIILLSNLRHKNLVNFLGCVSPGSQYLWLVYEYMSNGTVADYLHGKKMVSGALTLTLRIQIASETAEAIAYLHSTTHCLPKIHGDIKTDNILLDDKFHAKVADFGLIDVYLSNPNFLFRTPGGTQGYLDPEYDKRGTLTDKSDVYSFGVVLLELISGELAVDVERDDVYLVPMALNKIQNKQLDQLVDENFRLGYHSDEKIRELINSLIKLACRCLEPEGASRPSMEEVVKILNWITEGENCVGPAQPTRSSLQKKEKRKGKKCVGQDNEEVIEEIDATDTQVQEDDFSRAIVFYRVTLQDNGFIKMVAEVRRVYGHAVSSIALFYIFKNTVPHTDYVPAGDQKPWSHTCHCRRYIKNWRNICQGLHQSRCFNDMIASYVTLLAAITGSPWEMSDRNRDRVLKYG